MLFRSITSTFSENVLIEDNFITLNSNVTGGSPSENAGIEISRGASANVQLLWNENTDQWQFTNDGSAYYNLPTSVVNSWNGLTGAVTGVTAVNAGSGISVSGTTNPTITNTGVTGFNGATGNVTGVTGVAAGTGISISGTTRPTITNTGVQTFNGLTGAVTGVTAVNAGTNIVVTGTTNPTVATSTTPIFSTVTATGTEIGRAHV